MYSDVFTHLMILSAWYYTHVIFPRFFDHTLRESSVLQGTYFMVVESMPGKYRKVYLNFTTVFGWTQNVSTATKKFVGRKFVAQKYFGHV